MRATFLSMNCLVHMYLFLLQFLTVFFSSAVINKPHDDVAKCAFILELGKVNVMNKHDLCQDDLLHGNTTCSI
jgi:hypothetical protein